MIYCGYQGVGKSTYCREHENALDFDSHSFPFKFEGWEEEYAKSAIKCANKKYDDVFISAHKEVINYLIDNDIEFAIIVPKDNKEVWRKRLEFRYEKIRHRAT